MFTIYKDSGLKWPFESSGKLITITFITELSPLSTLLLLLLILLQASYYCSLVLIRWEPVSYVKAKFLQVFLPRVWNTEMYSHLVAQRCSRVLLITFVSTSCTFSFGQEQKSPSAALNRGYLLLPWTWRVGLQHQIGWAQWPRCSLACRHKCIKQ